MLLICASASFGQLVQTVRGIILDKDTKTPLYGAYITLKPSEMLTTTDETTGEVSTAEVSHRYRISLLDNSIAELSDADVLGEPTDIVRLSGRYFVVTQLLELADENLQRLFLDTSNAYAVTEIDVAKQADTLFALDNNSVSIKRYIPHVNDFGDDQITLSLSHDYHPQLLGGGETISDFIVTNDEANIYLVSKTSEWLSFNGEEFVDHGLLTTNENIVTFLLAKNNAGQANYLRVDLSNGNGFYLDMYDDNQTISATVLVQERLPSSMALSSDNQRLLIHADSSNEPSLEPEINLVTIAQ